MFDKAYTYTKIGTDTNITKKHLIKTHIYMFNTDGNERYIINVEEYSNQIFILKFHPRRLKRHKYRYNLLTNKGNFTKIVRTNIDVLIYFHKKFPGSHFGFLGAKTYCPIKKCFTEKDNTTARFRLYKYCVVNLIDPNDFEHYFDPTNSTYLLINSKCQDVAALKKVSKKMFEDCMN